MGHGATLTGLSRIVVAVPCAPSYVGRVVSIASESEAGRAYAVDTAARTCTCPHFAVSCRSTLPFNAPSRLCKHLWRALEETGAFDGCDTIALMILRCPYTKDEFFEGYVSTGGRAVIGCTRRDRWLDVYAPSDDYGEPASGGGDTAETIRRYGFNVLTRRWASGPRPAAARELRALFAEACLADYLCADGFDR